MQTIAELISFLSSNVPNFLPKNDIEFASASPYGEEWAGTDGFIWHFHPYGNYTFARVQARRLFGEGVWTQEVKRLQDIWNELPFLSGEAPQVNWVALDEEVKIGAFVNKDYKPITYAPSTDILKWHLAVDYEYWAQAGFSKALVDHFHLGYGQVRGVQNPARHIIPIPLAYDPSAWTMVTRTAHPEQDEMRHWRPKYSPTTWWYSDYKATQKSTVYIAEGSKSFLAAIEMGFSPAITTNHGATRWLTNWTYDILYQHPEIERIVFLGDADDIGVQHNIKLLKSFHKLAKTLNRPLDFYSLIWDENAPKGFDNADILQAMGPVNGAAWIDSRIFETPLEYYIPSATHNKYVEKVRDFIPLEKIYSLDALRSPSAEEGIIGGIEFFLKEYKAKKRKGTVYVNASPPGTGKNYALIEVVQRRARIHLERLRAREAARQRVADELEFNFLPEDEAEQKLMQKKIEKLRRPINKRLAVVASPFRNSFSDMRESHQNFDETLWFYFRSREKSNCENFEQANRAARLGYNVSFAVCSICPFAEKCRREGYLAQFDQMQDYPIISIRHQHLPISDISGAKEVYIDEWAGDSLMLDTISFKPQEIFLPQGWEEWLSGGAIEPIRRFVRFLTILTQQGCFSGKTITAVVGRDFFELAAALSMQAFKVQLDDLLNSVDLESFNEATLTQLEEDQEQPDDTWKEAVHFQYLTSLPPEAPKRGLDVVLQVLQEELSFFEKDLPVWNSRVTLVGNELQVRPMEGLHFPSTRPVVVLDATPVKALYEKLFPEREVIQFQPLTKNPDTVTTVLFGNGFGNTEMKRDIAPFLKTGKRAKTETKYEGHPNRYLQVSYDCVVKLAEQHESLLVITHKDPLLYLKKSLKDKYPTEKLAFANYGAVRGLNTYKGYQAVLLIGIHQKPSAVFETEMQAWYHDDEVPLALDQKVRYHIPYHDRTDGWEVYSYKDVRLQEAYFASIQNELIQSASRIRPHTSEAPKSVYMLGSFPALPWVSHTVYYPEFIYGKSDKEEKRMEVARYFIRQYFTKYLKPPSQREFLTALQEQEVGMSAAASRDLLKKLIEELQ